MAGIRNGNPTIDRMVRLLEVLMADDGRLTLDDIAAQSGVTRSSTYRMLNALEHHQFVRRTPRGDYRLGVRFLTFGEAVAADFHYRGLPEILLPWMQRLARASGESVRLSIYDTGTVLLVAGVAGPTSHSLTFTLFDSLPIHAGGASKVLFAHLPDHERAALLTGGFDRLTPLTLTDPAALTAEMAQIRAQGWATDPGEYSERVQSYAVPVVRPGGQVVAAVSLAFAATPDTATHDRIRTTLLDARPEADRLIAAANI